MQKLPKMLSKYVSLAFTDIEMFLIVLKKKKKRKKKKSMHLNMRGMRKEDCIVASLCAVNLRLRFLGHLSAGSYSHCSNLSAYYVTHWPTSPYTYTVCNFPLSPCLPMTAGGTDRDFSVKVRWLQMKRHKETASLLR